jgi:hypothetical protein
VPQRVPRAASHVASRPRGAGPPPPAGGASCSCAGAGPAASPSDPACAAASAASDRETASSAPRDDSAPWGSSGRPSLDPLIVRLVRKMCTNRACGLPHRPPDQAFAPFGLDLPLAGRRRQANFGQRGASRTPHAGTPPRTAGPLHGPRPGPRPLSRVPGGLCGRRLHPSRRLRPQVASRRACGAGSRIRRPAAFPLAPCTVPFPIAARAVQGPWRSPRRFPQRGCPWLATRLAPAIGAPAAGGVPFRPAAGAFAAQVPPETPTAKQHGRACARNLVAPADRRLGLQLRQPPLLPPHGLLDGRCPDLLPRPPQPLGLSLADSSPRPAVLMPSAACPRRARPGRGSRRRGRRSRPLDLR